MKRVVFVAAAALLGATQTAGAAIVNSQRTGSWETTFRLNETLGQDYTTHGSKASTDDSFGIGFGLSYNADENWAFGGVFDWASIDYDSDSVEANNPNIHYKSSGSVDTSTLALNATYNFLSRSLTPFVSMQLGMTYINTDVPNGPPQNVCWWDPWWGYYCGTVVPTRSDTDFSYGGSAGVRWEINPVFFVRGQVSEQWVDVGGSVGTADFTVFRLEAGWKFY